MNDKGKLNMRNVTQAIHDVLEWYDLGMSLGVPDHKLNEIRANNQHSNSTKNCKYSLVEVWLRIDVNASWGKLVEALEDAGETTAAGRVKEINIGIPASDALPHSAFVPRSLGASLGAQSMPYVNTTYHQRPLQTHQSPLQMCQPLLTQQFTSHQPPPVPQLVGGANHHGDRGGGFISSDGATSQPAPVTNVTEAMQLLRTDQEKLISGLTYGNLDVNFASGAAPGMTLLHYAAMQGAKTDCLKALIAFGAEVNPLNEHGLTPLDLALMSNPAGGEMVTLLEAVGGRKGRDLTHGFQPTAAAVAANNDELESQHFNEAGHNILSLSSSGPHCIVQLQTLQLIEAQSKSKITHLFHWIVASGFGALFLLLIIYGNKAVSEVKRLYFKLRDAVLSKTNMARRSQALDSFLQAHLGTQMKMVDIQQPRVLIGALYKGTTKVEVRLFNNCLGDEFSDVPVWKVARYTCSLPLNVMESDNYVSTDPAMPNLSSLALRRIRQCYSDSGQDPGMVRSLVCVDAGKFDAKELGCVDVQAAVLMDTTSAPASLPAPQLVSSPGDLQGLGHLMTLYHSSSLVAAEETLACCRDLCEHYDIRFHNFNPILSGHASLSVDLSLKDLVESVMESIPQVVGKPLHDLLTDILQNH